MHSVTLKLERDRVVTFVFTPPGDDRKLLAAAQPVRLASGSEPFGWLLVAKPVTELREQWLTLLGRLALALAAGVALAGVLFWWLSRRLTEPVLALAQATEHVAAGRYDVEIPVRRGSDEISLLTERFRGMVEKLSETERLKRSFLMSVTHELRTPLTAIRGHVEALREGVVSDPEQVAGSLEIIALETDRLERLVGDVLDLAKLQAHRFTVRHEEVDMSRVLEQAFGAFTEEARRREIDYRVEANGEAPVIVSDGDRVLQVISNLLSNAFRWTPTAAASSSSSMPKTVRWWSTWWTRGRAFRRSSASASFRRSSPTTLTAPGSGSRSRVSLRLRLAAGSRSSPASEAAVVSGSCCR